MPHLHKGNAHVLGLLLHGVSYLSNGVHMRGKQLMLEHDLCAYGNAAWPYLMVSGITPPQVEPAALRTSTGLETVCYYLMDMNKGMTG